MSQMDGHGAQPHENSSLCLVAIFYSFPDRRIPLAERIHWRSESFGYGWLNYPIAG